MSLEGNMNASVSHTSSLLDELNEFFRASATISEKLTPELLAAISVPHPLQGHIEAHVRNKWPLILSGTAGSGKTHLIRSLRRFVDLSEYQIIEDLAAVKSDWESIGSARNPLIVAANEGALLEASRCTSDSTFYGAAVELLHQMQVGTNWESKADFLLVDMAAADAANESIFDAILTLPILADYARSYLTPEQFGAWRLLENPGVRLRVSSLVSNSAIASDRGSFTFRHLWQCVRELLDPSDTRSPWPWRLFKGNSVVARAIQAVYPLETFSLSAWASRLWYRDIDALAGAASECAIDALWDFSSDQDREGFDFLRSIAILTLDESPVEAVLRAPRDLWLGLHAKQDSGSLIPAINRYLTYGLRGPNSDLELWIPTDLERRTSKPQEQVSLGMVSADKLKIVRNRVMGGRVPSNADEDLHNQGTRLSLIHEGSGAALSLSRDLITAITGTRSSRQADRGAVEYDSRLFRFLSRVATQAAVERQLHAVSFDFAARESRTVKLQLSPSGINGEPE